MQKIALILTLLALLMCMSCAADDGAELGSPNASNVGAVQTDDARPEAALVKQAMDSIGTDLTERAKAAGYNLIMRFYHQKYNPPEGWTPNEEQAKLTDDRIFYSFELHTPDGVEIDYALVGEIGDAILNSGLFYLTAEQIADTRWLYTSAEAGNERVIFNDVGVEIYMLSAPFGKAKILQFRYARDDLLTSVHYCDWQESYTWGER